MTYTKKVYLDYQASTPVASGVFLEMRPYFCESFANPHSADHASGWEVAAAVEAAAGDLARLIGCDSDEIVFTSGATESNNMALLGIGRRAVGGRRHRILIGATEHKCVLTVARVLSERHGFSVEILPVDGAGFIDVDHLERLIDEDVLLTAVMAVNNEIGAIQPLGEISAVARRHGGFLHCDAAQAALAIDMSALCSLADTVSLSGHKMYGPKGIGVLYVPRSMRKDVEPIIYGGGQQHGLRSGTAPVALCVGMGAAANFVSSSDTRARIAAMRGRRDDFVEKTLALGCGIAVNGPSGSSRHPGNANLRFPGFSSEDILTVLQPWLAASTGAACTSGAPEPSHVLRAIGLSAEEAGSSIRFSLGLETTDEEVLAAVSLLENALQRLRETVK